MTVELIGEGAALLKRGQWKEARAAFERALDIEQSAEALEGLGTSCSWLNDGEGAVMAREEAFRLYARAGDDRSAARVAMWLANEYGEFRREGAIASGWLNRARRLVENLAPCEEQATVLTMAASVKLFIEKEPAEARTIAAMARTIAEKVKSADGLVMANALEGLARVSEGEVREGMRLLDEATATAVGGECENLQFVGSACCCLIAACERVQDYERAGQWCEHVKQFCRRWRIGSLFAVCRTQYSAVLISRGEWSEAEEELISATEELSERRPGLVGDAAVRLAELRRRQGRFDEARALFHSAETPVLSLLGRSAMALDENDVATAADYAQRFLRRIPASDKVERVPGLELLVRSYTRSGEMEKAKQVLAELQSIVKCVATVPLQAMGRFTEGIVAAVEDQHAHALACFEDAVDSFEKACMPYESIGARIELAWILHRLQRGERAHAEARSALAQAEKLDAAFLVQCACDLLTTDPERPHREAPQNHGEKELSPREREILLLIAEGKDNFRIADQLFLSVRTVERHISNMYQKLGLAGKSARTAATAYAFKNLSL